MRLVRFSTRPAQISPDIRAALTSLGRGDDRVGGIGLVGVQPPETGAPVDAVVVTAHGVVVVAGVDLPDPAIRLEAPLHGVWKADGWPLTRDEDGSAPDAGNPAEDALALSEQVAQRVRTTVGSAELAVGTVIAVGPFVEHVEQPADELSGPVRIVYPTSTSLLASIVSLCSASRPLTIAQARAVITALSPETELDDDALAGEGFADDNAAATSGHAATAGNAATAAPAAAPSPSAAAKVTTTGATTPDTRATPGTTDTHDTTDTPATTDAADATGGADPLTDDADTEALDHTPPPPTSPSSGSQPSAARSSTSPPAAAAPGTADPGTAGPGTVAVPGTATVAANPSGSPSAPATAPAPPTAPTPPTAPAAPTTASPPAAAPQPVTNREARTGAAATSAATTAPWQPPQTPAPPSPHAGAPPAPQAGRPVRRAGGGRQPHPVPGAAAGAGRAPAPRGTARPVWWRRLSAQTWRWIAAGAAFVVAVVVIITFTAMSGGDTGDGPVRTSAGGLEFTQHAAQLTEKCADHAVGDLSVALADGGCTELRRGSFATTVRGTDVAVSVAALTFTDRQAAQRFLEVADTPGTGTIRDLATSSGRWAPPAPDWSGAAYVSDLEGSTVRLVLASPRDRASTESPEVTEAAEAALGLVKLND